MSRRRNVTVGAFALLLVATPWLPRPDDPDDRGAIRSAAGAAPGLAAARAGAGPVDATMRRQIEAVVAAGRTAARQVPATARPAALLRAEVRCARFEGQQYCLHAGWTDTPASQLVSELAARTSAARARSARSEHTGDLDLVSQVRAHASRTPRAQARAERAELTAAAQSVAKVWLLRHQVQGTPLPRGFLARHPEVRVAGRSAGATAVKPASAYPQRWAFLRNERVSEQIRSYWCGPASMQMIAWNWYGRNQGQTLWAQRLRTTTSGTSINAMVWVTNAWTGWDRPERAGRYITLDIGRWSYAQWMLLLMRHYVDYVAPTINHPVLRKEFFPYLDDNASGHFQVGRGYDKRGSHPNLVSYYEPWNQKRFDPSEPHIARVQWRSAYKSYRANRAHPQHNIGV